MSILLSDDDTFAAKGVRFLIEKILQSMPMFVNSIHVMTGGLPYTLSQHRSYHKFSENRMLFMIIVDASTRSNEGSLPEYTNERVFNVSSRASMQELECSLREILELIQKQNNAGLSMRPPVSSYSLSRRELIVLRSILTGSSLNDVSKSWGTANRAAYYHRRTLMRKIGAKTIQALHYGLCREADIGGMKRELKISP